GAKLNFDSERGEVKMKYRFYYILLAGLGFVLTIGFATTGFAEIELIDASKEGSNETVKALLVAGADVNAKSKKGRLALIFAAANGHTDAVQALLAADADVKAKANNGATALMIAKKKGTCRNHSNA
ncbi:MAG: ankyrin repeat domain-containing protein, partial [Desulfobacterales bacterium]